MSTPKYTKMSNKPLNNVCTSAYKKAPALRELSDASMTARNKDSKPGKPLAGTESKIKFQCLFSDGKVRNIMSESTEKIAKYIAENAHRIQKVSRI